MKTSLILSLLSFGLLGAGCHRQNEKSDTSLSVKAEDGKIVVPQGSPQAASVNVEAAQPCQNSVVTHLNGQLMWDEAVTVRVFTPFSGRVIKILAEVGKRVSDRDCLAMIASPEYGQAQADYRSAVSAFQLAQRNLSRIQDLFEN